LDNDSFSRFIKAREENTFAEFDSYLETDRQLENSGQPIITKIFDKDDATVAVRSGYMRQDSVIFVVDFWSFSGEMDPFKQLFSTIFTSVTIQSYLFEAESSLPLVDNKTITNEYYRVAVPVYWSIDHTHIENSYSTTLVSPDERVIVQVLVILDDQVISKGVLSELVLDILRERYTKGVWITSYETLPNGQEKLIWTSYQGNYEGLSQYKTLGSILYVVTGIWDSGDDAASLQGTAERIIGSFEFLYSYGE
jgi:hypothetical protein